MKIEQVKTLMKSIGHVTLHNKDGQPFLEATHSQMGVHLTAHFRMREDSYGLTFVLATLDGADMQEVKRRCQQLRELNSDVKQQKLYFTTAQTKQVIEALLQHV